MLETIIKGISDISNQLVETITNVNFKPYWDKIQAFFDELLIDDEQKKVIEFKAKKWARFGLCIPRNAPLSVVNTPPQSNKEAIIFCDKYFTKNSINKLFVELNQIFCINHQDIKECKFLLDNQKYKSCCLLLFSFIDAIFLNAQPIKENERRKLPNSYKQVNLPKSMTGVWLFYFSYKLVEYILTEMYKNGKDFQEEGKLKLINRNYCSHGMMKKRANKYDCYKLLILIHYLYETITPNDKIKKDGI